MILVISFCCSGLSLLTLLVKISDSLGSMADLHYNQFTGTIQVIKAVGNHIVLTFCQNLPTSQLFSIVLTRHPNELRHDVGQSTHQILLFSNLYFFCFQEIQSIRSLLRRRGLSTNAVRKVCRNGSTAIASTLSLVILGALALIFRH